MESRTYRMTEEFVAKVAIMENVPYEVALKEVMGMCEILGLVMGFDRG